MAISFDINSLYQAAFPTYRGKAFDASGLYETDIYEPYPFDNVDAPNEESGQFTQVRRQIGAVSAMGQPLFMPVQIGDLVLPNEPTLSITVQKTIVETILVGSTRQGSVKELISTDDYQLTIRGIALNYQSTLIYPEDLVKGLHDLFKVSSNLPILSGLTALLGIDRIVIKSFSLPEMMGVQHAQAYEIQAVSDYPFILEL